MSRYTITLTADVSDRGDVTIRQLQVASADGLAGLPAVDTGSLAAAAGAAADVLAAAWPARGRVPGGGAAGRKPAARASAPPASAGPAAGRNPARRTTTSAAGSSDNGRRPYRRKPADLEAVLETTQSATQVARHYGVPRHTAQGWIKSYRQQATSPASASPSRRRRQ
jgi:hypothetical protein